MSSVSFSLYPIRLPCVQELTIVVGGHDAGGCCQPVDGGDAIRISSSCGGVDDDVQVQVVSMTLRIQHSFVDHT